ncbi:hypothetical protein ZWY2020_039753 [Hordeum vulgare]|nr:hypothetical protein ZWY2020_039753 [Hordeum vulgare]
MLPLPRALQDEWAGKDGVEEEVYHGEEEEDDVVQVECEGGEEVDGRVKWFIERFYMEMRMQQRRLLYAEVIRRHTDEHGTWIEDMVQDFDDARDSDDEMEESAKAFYEMLESSKRPLHKQTKADAESMDAELRQVANGFDYKVLKDGGKGSKALRGSFFVGGWWDGYFHSYLASSESVALYSAWSGTSSTLAPPVRGGRPPAKPRGTRGRERGRAVAATPSSPPPQADSPEHGTSRVDSSEVEATRSEVEQPTS